MSELERQLVALGTDVEFPSTPDLSAAVGARLREAPPSRPRLAIALVVLALAIGAAFGVPQARTAILRFFHLQGLSVERVETLPAAQERLLAAGLGRRVSLADAERIAGFRMKQPPLKRPLRRVYAGDGYEAALLRVDGKPVLLFEFRGLNFGFVKKFSGPETVVEPVTVNGRPGLWISGAPHVVTYVNRAGQYETRATRLAGNVLAWEDASLTLRLEGRLSKTHALRLARSISPG
ncbi:MAG: hypothetical protein WBB74_03625 [Gaiellaceae bacterium]